MAQQDVSIKVGISGLENIKSDAQKIKQELSRELGGAISPGGQKTDYGASEIQEDRIRLQGRVNDELEDFIKKLRETAQKLPELTAGSDKPGRELGILEKLKMEQSAAYQAMMQATNKPDAQKEAGRLKEIRDEISSLQGGEKARPDHPAAPFTTGLQTIAQSTGSAVGGAFGEVVAGGLNMIDKLGQVGQALASLNPGRIVAAGVEAGATAVATVIGLTVPRGQKLLEAQGRLAGSVGLGAASSIGGLEGYGLSASESKDAAISIAKSLGTSRGLGMNVLGQVAFEQGTGLGRGELGQLNQTFKYYSNQSESMNMSLGKMLDIFDKSGIINMSISDYTRMSETVAKTSQINQMQLARRGDGIDATRSAQMMAGLELIGGTFKGDTGALQQIDAGITSPGNDYQQALIFRALQAQNPGMSLRELTKRQQEGVFGKGNFESIMAHLETISGGGGLDNDLFVMNVAKMFTGENISKAEQLIRGGKNVFDRVTTSDKEGMGAFGQGARSYTTGMTAALKGLESDLEYKGAEFNDDVANFIGEIRSLIKSPTDYLATKKDQITQEIGSMVDGFLAELAALFGGTNIKPLTNEQIEALEIMKSKEFTDMSAAEKERVIKQAGDSYTNRERENLDRGKEQTKAIEKQTEAIQKQSEINQQQLHEQIKSNENLKGLINTDNSVIPPK